MRLRSRRAALLGLAGGAVLVAGALILPRVVDDLRDDTCDEAPAAAPPATAAPADGTDPAPAGFADVQARPADDLVDSIGFNTHLFYFDTTYGRFDDVVEPALADLGVRHIRDGGNVLGDDGYVRLLQRLHDDHGIGVQLIFDPRAVTPDEAQGLAEQVGDAVDAAEGPNEFDVVQDDWAEVVTTYSAELDAALAADPDTGSLPLVAPSLIGFDASAELADVDGAPAYDFGNMHPYAYPFCPSSGIDRELAQRRLPTPDVPMIATEGGWHTADEERGVSEEVQAKYLPRMFLENLNRGIVRTYAYELLDQFDRPEEPEANFGIIRADGSRKPAFDALARLVELTADPGEPFEAGSLRYRLDAPETVSQLLLQRRDGTFLLVLWNEVDAVDGQDLTVPVTLELEDAADITVHDVGGAEPVAAGSVDRLALDLPDRAVVLELS